MTNVDVTNADSSNAPPREIPTAIWRPGCVTYLLGITAFTVAALSGAWWLINRSVRLEFEAAADARRALGEPVFFAELEPAPLPPEQDGTQNFLAAAEFLNRLRYDRNRATSELLEAAYIAGNLPLQPLSRSGITINEDVSRRAEVEIKPALRELQLALDRGQIAIPHDYAPANPNSIRLDEVDAANGFSLYFVVVGNLAIQKQDAAAAMETVGKMFQLAELLRDEPFLVSQMARARLGENAMRLELDVLTRFELSAVDRARLDEMAAGIESGYRLRSATLGERAVDLTTLANVGLVADTDPDFPLADEFELSEERMWLFTHLPTLRYREMSYALRLMTQAADAVDLPGPEGNAEIRSFRAEIDGLPETSAYRGLATSMEYFREQGLLYRQRLNALRLAIRVDESYRRKGQFPATLDEVLDETLPAIPPGMLSGQPPVYRVQPTGFVIYDLGTDGVDDNLQQRDELDSSIELFYPELLPPNETPPDSPDANTPAGNL